VRVRGDSEYRGGHNENITTRVGAGEWEKKKEKKTTIERQRIL